MLCWQFFGDMYFIILAFFQYFRFYCRDFYNNFFNICFYFRNNIFVLFTLYCIPRSMFCSRKSMFHFRKSRFCANESHIQKSKQFPLRIFTPYSSHCIRCCQHRICTTSLPLPNMNMVRHLHAQLLQIRIVLRFGLNLCLLSRALTWLKLKNSFL